MSKAQRIARQQMHEHARIWNDLRNLCPITAQQHLILACIKRAESKDKR